MPPCISGIRRKLTTRRVGGRGAALGELSRATSGILAGYEGEPHRRKIRLPGGERHTAGEVGTQHSRVCAAARDDCRQVFVRVSPSA